MRRLALLVAGTALAFVAAPTAPAPAAATYQFGIARTVGITFEDTGLYGEIVAVWETEAGGTDAAPATSDTQYGCVRIGSATSNATGCGPLRVHVDATLDTARVSGTIPTRVGDVVLDFTVKGTGLPTADAEPPSVEGLSVTTETVVSRAGQVAGSLQSPFGTATVRPGSSWYGYLSEALSGALGVTP